MNCLRLFLPSKADELAFALSYVPMMVFNFSRFGSANSRNLSLSFWSLQACIYRNICMSSISRLPRSASAPMRTSFAANSENGCPCSCFKS